MPVATTALPRPLRSTTRLIAVVGNPNCGKTTLFNALTGLHQKVGNYPGVTVEKREGVMVGDAAISLIDLPGTYSLTARSLDEEVARDVLLGRRGDVSAPDAVLVVIDATNLERNLYLATQVLELGLPVVIACNVMDLLEQAGHRLDVERLSELLGVPVVPTIASRGKGLGTLRAALQHAGSVEPGSSQPRHFKFPQPLEDEVVALGRALHESGYARAAAADSAAVLLLSECSHAPAGRLPPSVRAAVADSLERLKRTSELDPALEVASARYAWLGRVVAQCLHRAKNPAQLLTERLDPILTHRVWGMLIFAFVMASMFLGIFTVAGPLMDLIEKGVSAAQNEVTRLMSPGPLCGLLRDGIVAGVGNVVAFFPQICILFLFIALLEDTGYMARAAFLMDRFMSRVGLHGKSFIPLLSCHACAVPGIMATRVIEDPRDRLVTILVAPLITCSARLPVYTILIAACLPGSAWVKGAVLVGMYALGIIAALTMATIFKKTLLKGPAPAFILELPPYRMPRPAAALRVMWDRSRLFLTRAGTIILAMTILLWAMMNFPRSAERTARYEAERQAIAATNSPDAPAGIDAISARESADNIRHSLAGRLGHLIEPAIRPLGYDWRIGIGIISSFAAREVFVGTMGVVLSVGDAGAESATLNAQMDRVRWPDGRRLFTPLAAVSLMVFYMLACQCMSTIAVVRRETNSWRWPLFMFAYMSVLAYVVSFAVYQVGTLLGWGVS